MNRERGIALITVLMSAVVLVMLSTTFVQLGRSGFLSVRQYEVRSIAMQACDSGLDYARAQLVQRPGWGDLAFGSGTVTLDDPNLIRVEEVGADVATNVVTGTLPRSESSFRVQVVNNLRGRARRDPPPWSRSGCYVPPRCALVAVEGSHRGITRRVEVLLTRRTVFSGAVRAGESFAVSLQADSDNALAISSNAPQANQVVANGNILLPDAEAVIFENRGGRGQLKAGADVSVNSTVSFDPTTGNVSSSTGTSLEASAASFRAQVATTLNANVQTAAPPSPPRFEPSQLKSTSAPQRTIPGGQYKFTSANSIVIVPEDGSGNITATGNYTSPSGAVVQLSNYRFLPQDNVRVTGNFTLSGEITRYEIVNGTYAGNLTPEAFPTSLGIGYNADGIPVASEDALKSRFVVDGDLTVQGDLAGSGQLFVQKTSATEGGDILIEGNSQMSASRTNGMAIVAEGNVKIAEVPTQAATAAFAMDAADFQLFSQAVDAMGSSAEATLNDWRETDPTPKINLVGSNDFPSSDLRGQIISLPGGYRNFVNATLLSSGNTSGGVVFGNQTFEVALPGSPPTLVPGSPFTGPELIDAFMTKIETDHGGLMTLGMHMRIREFLKSVDRGAPDPNLINLWDLTAFESRDQVVQGLVASQVSAYDQDARVKGLTLTTYLQQPNPYNNGMRRDLIFGGILYGEGNIYTKIYNNFSLLGTMFSNQTISFENLSRGSLTFDPASFEDHFDLAKLGLGVAFYWSDT